MLQLGQAGPTFACDAVFKREVVELDWTTLHDHKTLILLFNATVSADLEALNQAVEELDNLDVRVAVIFNENLFQILTWARRSREEGGPGEIKFPLIVDADKKIASIYDMIESEGRALWGLIIVDPVGRIRLISMSSFPAGLKIDELKRYATAV